MLMMAGYKNLVMMFTFIVGCDFVMVVVNGSN